MKLSPEGDSLNQAGGIHVARRWMKRIGMSKSVRSNDGEPTRSTSPTARPSDTPAHAVSSCGAQRKGQDPREQPFRELAGLPV